MTMTAHRPSRITTGLDMLRRLAREPGWKCVANGTDGEFTVTTPNRRKIVVRMRADEELDDAVWRALTDAGFIEHDRNGQPTPPPDPRDEKPMPTKTAKQAGYDAAVQRAANPYLIEPDDVHVSWFAEAHPAPCQRWIWLTPNIARYLLTHHNTDNRRLRPETRDFYRGVIQSEQWRLTHQGMAMDTRGVLQDGQHRLAAVMDAGEDDPDLKVPVTFYVGMDPANFTAIDENLVRRAADLFQKDKEKYPQTLQAVIRLVHAYGLPNVRSASRTRTSNTSYYDAFQQSPEELRAAAAWAHNRGTKLHCAGSALGAARFLLREANGVDNAYVALFLEGVATGCKPGFDGPEGRRVMLDLDDPREVLRNKFNTNFDASPKRYTRPIDQLGMMLTCWNNLVRGHHPKVLHFTRNNDIPRIMICLDSGPDASATPKALIGETPTALA